MTFIPTAGIPEEVAFFIDDDRKAFQELGMIVDELEIGTASLETIKKKLTQNDYIFVSGGNTFYLLQELKRTGTDLLIKQLVFEGKPYIGTSAGSMILGPNIGYGALMDDPEKASDLKDFSGLGVVDFYLVPHVSEEPFAEVTQEILNRYETLPLLPLTNKQVACIKDQSIEVKTLGSDTP